ncbi:MAG: hypothetical protein C0608_05230 [Deltaproteobacteria bacterium]|nr:MAG: hypothetical protein C0608_05230 [Deltaproteobacteria bacterium]
MRRRLFTPLDGILVMGLILLSLLIPIFKGDVQPDRLIIFEGRQVREVAFESGATIEAHGPLGVTRFEVDEEGMVSVSTAPCPNRLCVSMGPISDSGEMIICVPNRVALEVVGKKGGGVDAVSR